MAQSKFNRSALENFEKRQYEGVGKYGIPEISGTNTVGTEFVRFCDRKSAKSPQDKIVHFFIDDYKFICAWREPERYVENLSKFKAIIAPDFSLYTDMPKTLQILAHYRRQWLARYWQENGIDVIPDIVWGNEDSYDFCFDGLPKNSSVAISSLGVRRDPEWNGKADNLFLKGYNEMIKRISPTAVMCYGKPPKEIENDVIVIPTYFDENRKRLDENMRRA